MLEKLCGFENRFNKISLRVTFSEIISKIFSVFSCFQVETGKIFQKRMIKNKLKLKVVSNKRTLFGATLV